MIVHGGEDTMSPIVVEVLSDDGRLPRDANARLVTAAPDLLAACRSALQFIGNLRVPQTIEDAALQVWKAQGVVESLENAIAKTSKGDAT